MLDHFHTLRVGEAALVRGHLADAEAAFTQILASAPAHDGALTDLALVRVQQGQPHEAATLFRQALAANPRSDAAFYGLLDAAYEADGLDAARAAFEAYGAPVAESEEKQQYRAGLGLTPEPGRLRILFVCGPDEKFVMPLEQAVGQQHEVRTLHFKGPVDLAAIQRGMDWADVTWFEWCDPILVNASQKLRKTSRVVCRLHSYEAFTPYPQQVNWSFVDHLIFVAPHIAEVVRPHLPPRVATTVILNGVDLDELPFTDRPRGFNLAYLGYLNFKKNPELLLQVMARLVQVDPRYHLHIAGSFQEPRYRLYFEKMIPAMGLQAHVHLYGWIDDVDAWLADKSYILSTSVLEGCPMNVLESMAKGLKPIIHDWVGAEGLYPEHFRFRTVEEAVALIRSDDYAPAAYRAFVAERYALAQQVDAVGRLLAQEGAEGRAPHERASGDGVAVSAPAEVAVAPAPPSESDLWKPVDPTLAPFLSGEQFHNGLRIPFGVADAEVPVRPDFLERLVAGKAIIDLGCTDHAPLVAQKAEQGRWLHSRLAQAAAVCLGVDIDEAGIAAARTLGYDVLQLDVVHDPVPDEIAARRWDYLIIGEVLEHIGNPVAFLTAIRERYAPFVERLVITVPSGLRVDNYAFGQQGLEVINSDHRFWFSPYTLLKVMSEAGLTVEGYRLVQSMPVANPESQKLLRERPLFRDGIAAVGRL